MEYSIASLAKNTRVTARTLRHYDQIGLLKPSIRIANGRRVYSDKEFMRLCEIVFFKKIGIGLPKIKGVFLSKNSNQAAAIALTVRKKAIFQEIQKLERYAAWIDTVLPQYANCHLSQKERIDKFSSLQTIVKEVEEMQIKEFGKEAFERTKEKVESLSEEEVEEFTDQSIQIMNAAVKAVEQGLDPSSKQAQKIVKRYYDMQAQFDLMTQEIFLKYRDAILNQREYYAAYHPKLPEFLYQAFDVFATKFFNK